MTPKTVCVPLICRRKTYSKYFIYEEMEFFQNLSLLSSTQLIVPISSCNKRGKNHHSSREKITQLRQLTQKQMRLGFRLNAGIITFHIFCRLSSKNLHHKCLLELSLLKPRKNYLTKLSLLRTLHAPKKMFSS